MKLQIDPSGHCEVLTSPPGPEETTQLARPAMTDIQARPATACETPARPAMLAPDNFETPPPEALRLNKLEDFQVKQKIIEEQNRCALVLNLKISVALPETGFQWNRIQGLKNSVWIRITCL